MSKPDELDEILHTLIERASNITGVNLHDHPDLKAEAKQRLLAWTNKHYVPLKTHHKKVNSAYHKGLKEGRTDNKEKNLYDKLPGSTTITAGEQ